jgi:hypothetical protein
MKQALERYGWEHVEGVCFPDDDSSESTTRAPATTQVRVPVQEVLDVG